MVQYFGEKLQANPFFLRKIEKNESEVKTIKWSILFLAFVNTIDSKKTTFGKTILNRYTYEY